ncbi:MAG: MBL fold metallo-hydrolase [Bacteroidales bacterium]
MKKFNAILTLILMATFLSPLRGQMGHDTETTSGGPLDLFFVGHGTLMFKYDGKVIHVDPVMAEADYATLPDADLILVTHQHGDHLDMTAIGHILKNGTELVMTQACMDQLENVDARVMKNGDRTTLQGIAIEALPAYNVAHTRPDGNPFHPKGQGNAYLLTFGDTRVLVGGDTENIPELKALKDIDIAFLPMNLPYTMTPAMVADLARAMKPGILYPYHFGETDTGQLVDLLKDEPDIQVRIRELQ